MPAPRRTASRGPIPRLIAFSLCLILAGGATTPLHGLSFPGRSEWKAALHDALHSPGTWVPALAAAAVSPWDTDISRWAVRETPIFGSPERARAASDGLRTASHAGMVVTALLVHTGTHPWTNRFERLLCEEAGAVAATTLTHGLKEATNRRRPDGSDNQSFPSGHSSRVFAYNAGTWRNLSRIPIPPSVRRGLRIGFDSLAAGTAWARVEAGVHYPSDVLAGAALGNFASVLLQNVFLRNDEAPRVTLDVGRRRRGIVVELHF